MFKKARFEIDYVAEGQFKETLFARCKTVEEAMDRKKEIESTIPNVTIINIYDRRKGIFIC